MAGDARRVSLEDAVRADGRGGRALLEQTNPRDVAAALMRLCAARHSDTGTCQRAAAAAISISRAVAPARRK